MKDGSEKTKGYVLVPVLHDTFNFLSPRCFFWENLFGQPQFCSYLSFGPVFFKGWGSSQIVGCIP